MKQAVLIGERRFEFQDVATPSPAADEVVVRMRASGICASELHAWQDGEDAPSPWLGHEVSGEVVAMGADVKDFALGDRVTGLFAKGFSDYVMGKADRVLPIPDAIPTESAFGEPLACAVSAARRTRVELGDRVAIVGQGFMGLLMLQLLRLEGPAFVLGLDLRDDAVASGLKFGCDLAMTPDALAASADPALEKFDVVVEATGTQEGLTLATSLTREHGVLSILGYHQGGPRSIDMTLWNYRALEVLNAHERRVDHRMDCMRRGLALAAAGRIDLVGLTTHRFGLEQVGEAFIALAEKPPGFIKAVLVADAAPNQFNFTTRA